jgi:hypothetical protein
MAPNVLRAIVTVTVAAGATTRVSNVPVLISFTNPPGSDLHDLPSQVKDRH